MATKTISDREFIFLNAMLISLGALATDMILPALPNMAQDMGQAVGNKQQWTIAVFFISINTGGIFFGPLSDSIGRRNTIAIGTVIFVIGSLMSALTNDFNVMLWGRFLQGLGASAIFIAMSSLLRDKYSGRNMARIMSFTMSIFIMVPTVAPLFGQMVMMWGDWHAIFYVFIAWALISFVWLWIRQPETLAVENRLPFNMATFKKNLRIFFANRTSVGYSIVNGFSFSLLLSYLLSSQQIFVKIYDTGTLFPAYFAVIALAVGIASFVNGKLVMQMGMRKLYYLAAKTIMLITGGTLIMLYSIGGDLSLVWFMGIMVVLFFCLGLTFGNTVAIAIEPLGHIAGIANAIIRLVSGVIAVGMGVITGQAYDGTIVPLFTGFFVAGVLAYTSARYSDK